jgi:biotin synthase
MAEKVEDILKKEVFNKEDLIALLDSKGKERQLLFEKAAKTKAEYLENKVYFRGLIEYSNICSKNCFYCGIRASIKTERYELKEQEVIDAVLFAWENHYGSVVIQSGERNDQEFIRTISRILDKIKKLTNGEIGITLSLGEQTEATYEQWFESGAHRYLLRIEVSEPELYGKIHPNNASHSFNKRLECLYTLKKIGYQVGTGVMIGLPFQTTANLAADLLFFKQFDVDMVGMGPYIEHKGTPLYEYRGLLLSKAERFDLSLKMVALLRIMMKDINIAATTAMQAIDPLGREKAIKTGANVIMPNITPVQYRPDYLLYEDKPCINEIASDCKDCLEARIHIAGSEIGYSEWGDSRHFAKKRKGQ